MDEVGDPLKFYVGEKVDNIISFRLNKNDEKIGLLTCSQSAGTLSLWEWDSYDTKLPILLETRSLSNPISCIHLTSSNSEATRFIVSEKNGLSLFQISKRKINLVVGPVGQGDVLCFDVTRNGTHLLAAGADGYLRFYSITDLSLIRTIRAAATSLHVARFATDALIYCASNNKVEVWDLQKSVAEPILYLENKENKGDQTKGKDQEKTSSSIFIWDICVHPDQPFICAAVDSEGYFAIWDLRKKQISPPIVYCLQYPRLES
jgi:WD40 repeat protein